VTAKADHRGSRRGRLHPASWPLRVGLRARTGPWKPTRRP